MSQKMHVAVSALNQEYIEFFCNGRDKDTGFSGNLSVLGRDL